MKLLCTFALAVVAVVPALAQTHPDFSGTWVEDVALRKTTRVVAQGGGGSRALPPLDTVVRQSATELVTERTFMGHTVRHAYRLDGRESVNRNGAVTETTKTRWEGARLITEGSSFQVTSAGESSWEHKEVRWLEKSGAMVTEMTTKDEAGKVDVVTQTFRRK